MNGLNVSWNISTWLTRHLQPRVVLVQYCEMQNYMWLPGSTTDWLHMQGRIKRPHGDRNARSRLYHKRPGEFHGTRKFLVIYLGVLSYLSLLQKRVESGNPAIFYCNMTQLAFLRWPSLIINWNMIAIRVHQLSRTDCRLALILSRRTRALRLSLGMEWFSWSCTYAWWVTCWQDTYEENDSLQWEMTQRRPMAESNTKRNLLMRLVNPTVGVSSEKVPTAWRFVDCIASKSRNEISSDTRGHGRSDQRRSSSFSTFHDSWKW